MKNRGPVRAGGHESCAPHSPAARLPVESAIGLIIFLSTFVVFSPILRNGFVNWDDFTNVVYNSHYRGMGWEQFEWMFTTFHLSLYRPVTWMTLGLDYLVWGMDPFGYHLTSLVAHCVNAVLYYFIALRLLGLALNNERFSPRHRRIGAGCAALFFALHPLRVEAVAWVSARNDVVSALLVLLTILSYLRATSYDRTSPRRYLRWLLATFALFAVSLLAKASGMTLPVALLILDFYPLRRLQGGPRQWLQPNSRSILLEKIPLLLLAAAAGVAAVLAKQEFHAVNSLASAGWLDRIASSMYSLAFYLWKTMLPIGLSPLYQLSAQPDPRNWRFLVSAAVVLAITFGTILSRKRYPAALACWAWYAVLLIPVLGVVSFGPQIVADRYSYLSCLGWPLLAGAGAAFLAAPIRSHGRNRGHGVPAIGLYVSLFVGLGFSTWKQCQVWHDSERLWLRVLAINPASSYAYHNLATEMQRRGNIEGTIRYYRKAVALDPQFVLAHHNLANALAEQGKTDEAIREYNRALQINPNEASVHNDLGNLLVKKADWESAARHFYRSGVLNASASAPWISLGNVMVRLNHPNRAIVYFRQALKIDPNNAQAHNKLARLLAAQGKRDEAVDPFRAAISLESRFAAARQGLIQALTEQGDKQEAFRQHQIARQISPPSRATVNVR